GLLADGIPFFGWIGTHYWIDIGSPMKYRQAQLDLLAGRISSGIAAAQNGGGIARDVMRDHAVTITAPCVIGAGSRLLSECHVGAETVLGEQCVVGRGARVAGAVLWDRVSVGDGAVLTDCIVASGARIGAGAIVGAGVVLEADSVVEDHARVVNSEVGSAPLPKPSPPESIAQS